ncbi:STAS domain-containing protein [Ornithinicoccus halotolerans]|uniref:STAS domain-containing protein n=1 Tax=Ornithinicoccus halotolerans TaxID=1748220 RepID=UPI001296782E|nr:STAS domain-containing protein [Ornithinicoccus halotolerans]
MVGAAALGGSSVVPVEILVDSPGREVTLRGPLQVRTVPDVRAALHRALLGGQGDLVLHLAEAEVADATGLGMLVGLHHRARRLGRRLVIAEATERLERLLRITRLHLVLARLDGSRAWELPGPVPGAPPFPPIR